MSSPYSLRKYKPSDLAPVTRLHLSAFKEIGETASTATNFFASPKVTTVVLVKNKKVGGYYFFVKKGRSKYFGCWFSVAKKYRGEGLGELLMKDFLKRARKDNVKEVLLSTRNRFKSAMKIYLDLGFQIVRTYKSKDKDVMIEFRWTP